LENAKNRLLEQFSNGKIRSKEADERIMDKKNRRYETDTIDMIEIETMKRKRLK
jgi:hypothetical protein